jgi:acetolactate synthase-1/2/3 large subunit
VPTTAAVLARTLKTYGVRRLFGLPGGEIAEILGACRDVGLDFVLTRHENAACLTATATGELTGRPGVVLTTLGPGATNLVNGVANAFLERAPLLVISAQVSTAMAPVLPHQRVPLEELFRPLTKWSHTLTGQDTAGTVQRALELTSQGRPGPVYLALPSDVARQEDRPGVGEGRETDGATPATPPDGLRQALELLTRARRPVALVGMALDPRTVQPSLLGWLSATGIPVAVTPKAKGLVPETHPLFLATCTGMAGDRLFTEFLAGTDLLVGIGFDPVEAIRPFYAERLFLSLARYSVAEPAFRPAHEVLGDPGAALEAMLPDLDLRHEWRAQDVAAFRERLAAFLAPGAPESDTGFLPSQVIRRLRQLAPPDTLLALDTGAHKLLVGQLWPCSQPQTFFVSHGLSTMGVALPAAIALKLEHPDRPVIAVTGDGGLAMVLGELETAWRLRLPVVVLVMCDQALHLIRIHQERKGFRAAGVDFDPIDFAGVAHGLGARGKRAATWEAFDAAVSEALRADGPTVIEVPIDPAEYDRLL